MLQILIRLATFSIGSKIMACKIFALLWSKSYKPLYDADTREIYIQNKPKHFKNKIIKMFIFYVFIEKQIFL